jgi:hypothetical protein
MDVSLVFGIVLAAIVIGLLMFFGYDYISKMLSLSCESQLGQQIQNMKNKVKSTLTLSKGAAQEFDIMLQSNCVTKVCFVDPDQASIENKEAGWEADEFTSSFASKNSYNVIIIKPGNGIDGYQIAKLKPSVNFCLTSSKKVIFRNTGTLVDVSQPKA